MALKRDQLEGLRYGTVPAKKGEGGIPIVLFDFRFLGICDPYLVHEYLQEYFSKPPEGKDHCQAVKDFKKSFEEDPNSELTKKLAVYAGESILIYEQARFEIESLQKE